MIQLYLKLATLCMLLTSAVAHAQETIRVYAQADTSSCIIEDYGPNFCFPTIPERNAYMQSWGVNSPSANPYTEGTSYTPPFDSFNAAYGIPSSPAPNSDDTELFIPREVFVETAPPTCDYSGFFIYCNRNGYSTNQTTEYWVRNASGTFDLVDVIPGVTVNEGSRAAVVGRGDILGLNSLQFVSNDFTLQATTGTLSLNRNALGKATDLGMILWSKQNGCWNNGQYLRNPNNRRVISTTESDSTFSFANFSPSANGEYWHLGVTTGSYPGRHNQIIYRVDGSTLEEQHFYTESSLNTLDQINEMSPLGNYTHWYANTYPSFTSIMFRREGNRWVQAYSEGCVSIQPPGAYGAECYYRTWYLNEDETLAIKSVNIPNMKGYTPELYRVTGPNPSAWEKIRNLSNPNFGQPGALDGFPEQVNRRIARWKKGEISNPFNTTED